MSQSETMTDAEVPRKQRKRHPVNALTARQVQAAKPGKHIDGHGLMLVVDETGARRWVQRLVIRGRRREMGLGSVSLISLAEARDIALKNRKLARAGGDPFAVRHQSLSVPTFSEAARRVHALNRPTWRNSKHAAQFLSTLAAYADPVLGGIRVSEITSADVLRALTPIWTKKSETARRVLQRIGLVMEWSIAQGWRTDNPAVGIRRALPKIEKRPEHRKALHYGEVCNCLTAIEQSKAAAATKLALRFLVLTAARAGEVRLATWGEIAFHDGDGPETATSATWEIPASRMKMKRAHRVPLSRQALEVLRQAAGLKVGFPPGQANDLIFPGQRPDRPLSENTFVKLLRESGFEVDAHGFRTSFRTWTQERTRFSGDAAEAALAHVKKDKSEAAYARSDLFDERRKMMQAWADYLDAGSSDKVVSLPRRRDAE